jgi:type IV secretory pathway TraG/TraD family ATPase VirD4
MPTAKVLGALAAIAMIVIGALVVPAQLRASRRRRASALMPQWPDDWPPYAEFLSGRLPGWSPWPKLRGVPLGTWPAAIGRWIISLITLGVRLPDFSPASVTRFLADVCYWGPQRLRWRAPSAFWALPSGRYALGTGAIRLGLLQPRNWFERWFPLEIWMPRPMIYRHYALAGPTGSGKTTTIGISLPFYAAYANQSVIINDVKLANGGAEYFAWFVDHWRSHGGNAINFNPWTPDETLCCEPIHAATREELDIIVATLLKANSSGKKDGGGDKNPFFDKAGAQLLKALVLALQYAPRRYCSLPVLYRIVAMGARAITEFLAYISTSYPSLNDTERACRRLLDVPDAQLEAEWHDTTGARQPRAADITDALAIVDRSGIQIQQWLRAARALLWHAGQRIAEPTDASWEPRWGALRGLYVGRRVAFDEAIGNLGTVIEQPDQTFSNIVMTVQNTVAAFQAPELQRAFGRPEFDLRDVVTQPSLFVIGAPQAKWEVGAKFTAALFWELTLNLVYERGKEKGHEHANAVDVVCLMDEMPALGLESLANLLATIRSYKAPLIGMYQSVNQLKQTYGENYGTVLDNYISQGTLYGSGGETAKMTAERVGEAVMLKLSKSSSSQGGGLGQGSSSVSTSAERVKRMTDQDVTEMRVNGESLGERAALYTGKTNPPFLYQQIPWWEDRVIVEYMDAQFNAASGQTKLRENRNPFMRAPLFEVENPDKRDANEPWILKYDQTGNPIPDAHAHDAYRDTVDLLAPPPGGRTLYEVVDPPFDPKAIGLTPVTTEQLQATIAKKLGQQAPAPNAPATPPPPAVPTRTFADLIDALADSDAGLPNQVPMPMLEWRDGRHTWREIADGVTAAEAERRFVVPAGKLPGLHLSVESMPLEWYFANAVHTVLDFPSFVFKWTKHRGVGPATPEEAQGVIGGAVDVSQHLAGGVAACPLVWQPFLAIEAAAPAAIRALVSACLERGRDRLASADSPEVLVPVWADLRGELLELLPPQLDPATTRYFFAAEALLDYGARTRAQHLDLTLFADPERTPAPTFEDYLNKNAYPMPAFDAMKRAFGTASVLTQAIDRFPHRRAAALRLADAAANSDLVDEVRQQFLAAIVEPSTTLPA